MKTTITVREYARLTTALISDVTLDRASVSVTAFDWLCRLSSSFSKAGASLVQVEDRCWLRLDNYVGVIETPCGTRIEILPKHYEGGECVSRSRALLWRMIAAASDLPVREVGETSLQKFDHPLSEWVMQQFLLGLDYLIKRGVRSDYLRIEASERYLKGQMDIVKQMRQPPHCRHLFNIRHDLFVPDTPENRLLKRALELVCRLTQVPKSWRLSQELRVLFQDVPASSDITNDFSSWRTDRLNAHYKTVRPWCELVLYRQLPRSLVGEWHGISMLFPMEKLFERFVAATLRRSLATGYRLTYQASSKYLCEHDGSSIFRLEPDLLIEGGGYRWLLDTKWKMLNAKDREHNYGLSQADFYQLYAYGQKYLAGHGESFLVYPQHILFNEPLPKFAFGGGLNLRVLPFDLELGQFVDNGQTNLPFREHDGQRSAA